MHEVDRRTVTFAMAAGLLSTAAAGAPSASLKPQYPDNVVMEAAKIVREQYVDPLMAGRLADLLLANLRKGRYRLAPVALARKLTEDLRSLTNDLHLSVDHAPPTPVADSASTLTEDELHPRTTGWGVQTVARLQGNIGLLRITHFPSPPYRFDSRYGAAMELLQDTAALILDLSIHHGGGTDTTGFFLSYFLNGAIEFSRINWRNEPVEIIETSKEIPGRPYGEERPLFVVTSKNTFSAGEAVALELRKRKRALIVGTRTKGGAHTGNVFKLPNDFRIFVVMGRSEGPDWEGVGVAPDVEAAPENALAVAHSMALDALLPRTVDPKAKQILSNVKARSIENLSSFSL